MQSVIYIAQTYNKVAWAPPPTPFPSAPPARPFKVINNLTMLCYYKYMCIFFFTHFSNSIFFTNLFGVIQTCPSLSIKHIVFIYFLITNLYISVFNRLLGKAFTWDTCFFNSRKNNYTGHNFIHHYYMLPGDVYAGKFLMLTLILIRRSTHGTPPIHINAQEVIL